MNGSALTQSLEQLWGIIVLEYKYHGDLPSIENYHSRVRCALPSSGGWVVINGGVTEKTSHSQEIPAQRYAHDLVILDGAGSNSQGEETEAGSFYCYGRDILVPADGTVAEICTGDPDSRVTKNRATSCNARGIQGNCVLICRSDGERSLLAHLKPDSIRVSVGQSIKRGERIAECGSSGNTSEPHLRFQVQLGKGFCFSPGSPVELENTKVKKTLNYEKFGDRYLKEYSENYYPLFVGAGQTVYNVSTEGWNRDSII